MQPGPLGRRCERAGRADPDVRPAPRAAARAHAELPPLTLSQGSPSARFSAASLDDDIYSEPSFSSASWSAPSSPRSWEGLKAPPPKRSGGARAFAAVPWRRGQASARVAPAAAWSLDEPPDHAVGVMHERGGCDSPNEPFRAGPSSPTDRHGVCSAGHLLIARALASVGGATLEALADERQAITALLAANPKPALPIPPSLRGVWVIQNRWCGSELLLTLDGFSFVAVDGGRGRTASWLSRTCFVADSPVFAIATGHHALVDGCAVREDVCGAFMLCSRVSGCQPGLELSFDGEGPRELKTAAVALTLDCSCCPGSCCCWVLGLADVANDFVVPSWCCAGRFDEHSDLAGVQGLRLLSLPAMQPAHRLRAERVLDVTICGMPRSCCNGATVALRVADDKEIVDASGNEARPLRAGPWLRVRRMETSPPRPCDLLRF